MADGHVYFAEDVFGVQFCLREGAVYTFDPEIGAFDEIAPDLDAWAETVLDDVNTLTGYPLAHEWQSKHGRLPVNCRLIPITPFVLGGEYTIANVRVLDAAEGMRYRSEIALQIRDVPDGGHVKLTVE